MKTVYLAGPVLNCDQDEANHWRSEVAAKLQLEGIYGVSPLRCEPLIGSHYEAQYSDPQFGTARAISSKNIYDVRNCDIGIYYLPTPPEGRHQSYGTICELAWANMLDKPTILVSDDPDIYGHPVISICAGWIVPDLGNAVEICAGVLGGYIIGGKHV